MAKDSVKTLEIPGNRGWMVIALNDVQRPDPKTIEPQRVAAIAPPLAPAFGNELMQQLAAEAKRRVGVTINKALVDKLRAELPGNAPGADEGCAWGPDTGRWRRRSRGAARRGG